MNAMKRAALVLALTAGLARAGEPAGEPKLWPFVLAYRTQGDLAKAADGAKEKLAAAGFELAGSYEPYEGALVLVVTSPDLKAAAAQSKFGAYGAGQRVSVTKVGEEVQVAYTNPVYMQHAYRMKGDLAPVAEKLAAALGKVQDYGPAEGKTPSELRDYHYMFGMEYFDEPNILGRFGSHNGAVKQIEAGLAAGKGGAKLVYKISVPESKETLIGVALTEECSGDGYIMKEVDFKPIRSTGHLPYEIVVSGLNAYALYGRFRIAINFTDLKMMGSHSFMNIRCAPEAILKSLKAVTSLH